MNRWDELKELFDKEIATYFDGIKGSFDATLYEAVTYAILKRGKRVRPVLMLLVAESISVEPSSVMPLAIALEMIHSYSLIHDDLPAMDNDDERSGQPTVHKKFDEATAILAGDALLNLSYELMLDSGLKNPLLLGAARFISDSAGYKGMIGGQVLDMRPEELTPENISVMYLKKTGALISAAILSSLFTSADVDEELFRAYERFAVDLGLAFQISDDIIDLKSGQDEGKVTLATLVGIEDSEHILAYYAEDIEKTLASIDKNTQNLKNYVDVLIKRQI